MKYYYNIILLLTIFSFMSIGLGQTDDLTDLTLYRNLNQEGFNSAARDTGDVISSFASPTSNTMGLAWNGEYLWISGQFSESIYKVTTLGAVIDSIPNPGDRGLAWDGEYLWAATTVDDRLYKINVETGEVVDSLDTPCSGNYPNGLTYDGELLWVSSFSELDLCGVNTNTGGKVDSISLPNIDGRGVAWTGTNFWWADQDNPPTVYIW
jgi:DNA-binding beta-propeller fold protein YncE